MFEEFRSNLLLLLQCKYPEGMLLDRIETEYLKYFYQTVQPYMFYIDAISWLEVMTETPLRNDTKVWEIKSEMYVKCISPRKDQEMKLIAKLAKYTHFHFAQNAHFHVDNCNCCSHRGSVPPKVYDKVFESSGVTVAKDIDLEDEHLDRGCFMGVLSPQHDDFIRNDFLGQRFINSAEDYSNGGNETVFDEVKREVSSPVDIDHSYTNDYLMNSQDLDLPNNFADIDHVKLENEEFPLLAEETSETKTSLFPESVVETKLEPPDAVETERSSLVTEGTEDKTKNSKSQERGDVDSDPNYEPESSDESIDKDDSDDSIDQQSSSQALPLDKTKVLNNSGTSRLSVEMPVSYVCEWKECKEIFPTLSELLKHIINHATGRNAEKSSEPQNVLKVACQNTAVAGDKGKPPCGNTDVPSEDKSPPRQRKRGAVGVEEIATPLKVKRKYVRSNVTVVTDEVLHCTTLGCNRTFATQCKLQNHQKRCCAINDFSCRWLDCTKVFESSLDLHNHVKIDHRKCTDDVKVPSGPGVIEKNFFVKCSVPSCGRAFTCPERLRGHEIRCTIDQKGSSATTAKTHQVGTPSVSPSTPSRSLANTTPTKSTAQPQPKGFARLSKYSE